MKGCLFTIHRVRLYVCLCVCVCVCGYIFIDGYKSLLSQLLMLSTASICSFSFLLFTAFALSLDSLSYSLHMRPLFLPTPLLSPSPSFIHSVSVAVGYLAARIVMLEALVPLVPMLPVSLVQSVCVLRPICHR